MDDDPALLDRARERATANGLSGRAAEAFVSAFVEGFRKAAAVERERCRAIVTSRFAAGRELLARHLAIATDMSVEEAERTMQVAPADPSP